jgi:hypothetical protein
MATEHVGAGDGQVPPLELAGDDIEDLVVAGTAADEQDELPAGGASHGGERSAHVKPQYVALRRLAEPAPHLWRQRGG